MTIAEIIAQLAAAATDDAKRQEVVTALHSTMQPVYQVIFNKGHGQGMAAQSEKLTAAEAAKTAAEQSATALKTQLEEATKKGTPDVEAIRTQHAQDLERIQKEAKEKADGLEAKLRDERTARAKADLKAALKGKVVDDFVDVAVERAALQGRIRHREDGSTFVVQAGTEVELQAPAGRTALELLAEEIHTAAPATLRLSTADQGGGTTTAAGGGTTGYDPVAAGKEKAKEQKASAASADLALR